jgi:WD40 repeat protein
MLKGLDLKSGNELFKEKVGHRDIVTSMAFTPDGRSLITMESKRCLVWDVLAGTQRLELPGLGNSMQLSPDGTTLVSLGGRRPEESAPGQWSLDSDPHLWDIAGRKEIRKFSGEKSKKGEELMMAQFSADGKSLFSCTAQQSEDHAPGRTVLRYWDSANGKLLREVIREQHSPRHVAVSPDFRLLAGSGTTNDSWGPEQNQSIWIVNAQTGNDRKVLRFAVPSAITHMAFSPDGNFFVTGSCEGWLVVWEATTGQVVARWAFFEREIDAVHFSPDSRILVVADSYHSFLGYFDNWFCAEWLWDAFLGNYHTTLESKAPYSIRFLDISSGQVLQQLDGFHTNVKCLSIAPDGKKLASGQNDGTILLWDVASCHDSFRKRRRFQDEELAQLWQQLGDEASVACRAMGMLALAPEQATALLRQHLRPITIVDEKRLKQLLTDLNDEDFDVRERADKELYELRGQSEVALERAAATPLPLEAKSRLTTLLAKSPPTLSPEILRVRRSLQLLEWIGSADAHALLKTMAHGNDGALETPAALQALERLNKRVGR